METARRILDFFVVRLVLLLGLIIAGVAICATVTRLVAGPLIDAIGARGPAWESAPETIMRLATLLPFIVVPLLYGSWIERKDLAELTVPLRPAVPETLLWTFLGGALISFIAGLYWVLGWARFSLSSDPAGDLVVSVFIGFALMLLVSVSEEILLRQVIFRVLEEGSGSVAALVVSALAFGFMHAGNPAATTQSNLLIALAGVFFAGIYMATRSLWTVIGLHLGWNFTLGYVWGMPVSGMRLPGILDGTITGPENLTGGNFGPEAGLVPGALFVVICAASLGVAVMRNRVYWPRWMQRLAGREGETLRPGTWVEARRLEIARDPERLAAAA
jgi:membrane protease YdiL (CAAX protease family)